MTLRPGTNWCGNRGEWPYVELATPSSFGCSYVRELFKPSSHGVVRSWIDGLGEEDFTNFSSILRAISCAVEEKEQGGMYAPCSALVPYVLACVESTLGEAHRVILPTAASCYTLRIRAHKAKRSFGSVPLVGSLTYQHARSPPRCTEVIFLQLLLTLQL